MNPDENASTINVRKVSMIESVFEGIFVIDTVFGVLIDNYDGKTAGDTSGGICGGKYIILAIKPTYLADWKVEVFLSCT